MKNKVIDYWLEEKEYYYKKLFEDNIKNKIIQFSINLPEVSFHSHFPLKDHVCYICDELIDKIYFSESYFNSGWERRRICLKCLSRIAGAVINPYHFCRYFKIDE